METYDEFVEVYSISDLHLNSFVDDPTAIKKLKETIDALSSRVQALPVRAGSSPKYRAALVLNGDIVDFLEVQADYFDPIRAPASLWQVFAANNEVWDSLDAFSTHGTVVLVLGNHDLELAMPACHAMLRRRISGSLVFSFDGSGYRCKVGKTTALFVHGNNQDPWNFVDMDRLRRIAAEINRRDNARDRNWRPNQGTELVIEVLNGWKGKHPFVQYLKPEGSWMLDLLSMLGFASRLRSYSELGTRQVAANLEFAAHRRSEAGVYLGGDGAPTDRAEVYDSRDLLLKADARARANTDPPGAVLGAKNDEYLGGPKPVDEATIREYIRKRSAKQSSFQIEQADEIYKEIAERLESNVHWVVCGCVFHPS